MPVRRLLCIAASASLLVGVAACGPDDADEPPTASGKQSSDGGGTSTSAASSQSPSDDGGDGTDGGDQEETTAPDVPEPDPADFPGMDKHTPEGAEQAFRYYWAMLLWGYQTGETTTLKTLYSDDCGNCISNVSLIVQQDKAGMHWSGGAIEDQSTTTSNDVANPQFDIAVVYRFVLSEHKEPSEDYSEVQDEPAQKYTVAGGMAWSGGRWVLHGIDIKIHDLDDQ